MPNAKPGDPDLPLWYEIILDGKLDPDWSDWLGALTLQTTITRSGKCRTILQGPIPDQAALRGILNKIWDLNLEVKGVRRLRAKVKRDT